MTTATSSTRRLRPADFKVPALLLALRGVPTLGCVVRLLSLTDGERATSETARFLDAPAPVLVHIVCATLYSTLASCRA